MKSYAFPGNINQEILQLGSLQIPYMRTAEFSAINKDSEKILLELIGCKEGKTIIYTASGTGAMAAVVENYVTTKQKAFVVAGGTFGYRWAELCAYYNCNYTLYKVPFGKDINYTNLEEQICKERPDVFLCQHHETSSGALFDIEKISRICQKYNISLVVDAISSFLAEPLNMDKLKIDICLTSSQKGLNIPPGLSIIFLSSSLKEYPFAKKGYYFEFENNLKNMERGQTPFSPATTIYLQLNKRIHQILDYGLENVISDVQSRASYFRKLCKKYDWKILAEVPSSAITGFYVSHNGTKIIRDLIEKYNIFIMPSGEENFFKVSHMGIQSFYDLDELALYIHQIEHSK